MKISFLQAPFMGATLMAAISMAHADLTLPARVELSVHLKDGSQLKAVPLNGGLKVNPRLSGALNVSWEKIKQVNFGPGRVDAKLLCMNDDRLTVDLMTEGLEVDCALGRLTVPISSIRKIEVNVVGGACRNIALGKPVHGRDGASHGQGLARHVTDGDPSTHAKPPGSSFDYRIDLQHGTDARFGISRIVINWGRFGDQYTGVRQKGGEAWASGSWPGEYVTSYVVECRKTGGEAWEVVHQHQGRPVIEDSPDVEVIKKPSKIPGCSSESITCIQGLNLVDVAELRVRAKGGHWIGLFELEAHGWQQ